MAVAGIDIGTTGAKCTIFDGNYAIRGYAYQEYDLIKGKEDSHYELDMRIVLDAVLRVLKTAVKQYGGADIAAICATSFGETFVLLDENDKILANSMIYMDSRGLEEARELEEYFGAEKLADIAGVVPHSMYSACKLMWLGRHRGNLMEKAKKLCFVADYILYALGAEHLTDYSLASRSLAFDVYKKEWCGEILDYIGVPAGILPGTVPSGTATGTIYPDVAAELGLPRTVKLVIGGHDQVAAALGGGVLKAGDSINGIGTVDCITTAFRDQGHFIGLAQSRYAAIPYPVDNLFVTYAFNMTGGSLLKWYKITFAQDLAAASAKTGGNVYKALDDALYPEPSRLLVLPHFAGAGTPTMDSLSRGAIVGLTFNTTREQIYRSMLEGETFEMKYNLDLLESAGVATNHLCTVGGGSKSSVWLQIRADIMNKPIMTLQVDEAGTLGSAIMAGTAMGDFDSLRQAVGSLVRVKRVFQPDSARAGVYSEYYQKYRKLYHNIKEVIV